MSLTTPAVRTTKVSDILHLDTYTAHGGLLIAKPPGEPFLVGRVYAASPLIGQSAEFADVIANLVKTQPDDAVIQVTEVALPDRQAASRLMVGKTGGGTHGNEALQSLVRTQADIYRQALAIGWRDELPVLNRRRVLITVCTPAARITDQVLEEARGAHLALLANLRACGFADVEVVDAAELGGMYRQLANPYASGEPIVLDELSEVKFQLFAPDLTLDFRDRAVGVIDGEIFCAGVACKAYPRRPFQGLMNLVTGALLNGSAVAEGGGTRIATPFAITTTIRVADQAREGNRIAQAISSRRQTTKLPIRLGPENPEEKLRDLELLQAQCGSDADSNKFVHVSTVAFVYGTSREQAIAAQSLLAAKFGHFQFEARTVTVNAAVRWAQSLPMNFSVKLAEALDNEVVMSSQAAGTLLPVFGDYAGNAAPHLTGRGGIPFITRRGAAYALDILRTDSTAHGFISASAGSGKSVFAQYLVQMLLAEGVTVFVLDNNRGLLNLATTVGGEFHEFSTSSSFGICLNPFTGLTDDEFDQQQETITSLLMLICYEGEPAAPGARIVMNEAVKSAWAHARGDAEFRHVIEALQATVDSGSEARHGSELGQAARSLVPRLKAFVESPTRGRFFRGRGSLATKHQLTVFDMAGLGEDTHLKRCVVFFILYQLTTRVRDLPGHKLALVDEAHALMDDEHAAHALEGLSLRGRKEGLALWLVLQSLNKMAASPAGRVMLNMAAWMVILAQKEEETAEALKAGLLAEFAKDPYFVRSLADVTTRKGQFSEAMVIGGGAYEVVRLYLDPSVATLYSSEREDRDAIFRLVEQGMPALDAVRQLMGDKRAGRRAWLEGVARQLRAEGLGTRESLREFAAVLR